MYRGGAPVVRISVRGSRTNPGTAGRRRDGGFTLIELMIAMTVLIIGIAGILSMQMTAMRSSAYSRHATEASVLGEDTMEALRTVPVASIVDTAAESINEHGIPDAGGLYTREWTITDDGTIATLVVVVRWKERGSEDHAITFTTMRVL